MTQRSNEDRERRERYVQAIFCGDDGGPGEAALHLVMAVADAEQAELRDHLTRHHKGFSACAICGWRGVGHPQAADAERDA